MFTKPEDTQVAFVYGGCLPGAMFESPLVIHERNYMVAFTILEIPFLHPTEHEASILPTPFVLDVKTPLEVFCTVTENFK